MHRLITAGLLGSAAAAVALAPTASATPGYYIHDKDGNYIGASYAQMTDQEVLGEFGNRVQDQIVQAPFAALVLASGVAEGDTTQVQEQERQQIDAPLYVVDPLIEYAARKLPADMGGGTNSNPGAPQGGAKAILTGKGTDGALMQWRDSTLLGLRDDVDRAVTTGGQATDPNHGLPADNNRAADLATALQSGDPAAITKASSFLEPQKVIPNLVAKATAITSSKTPVKTVLAGVKADQAKGKATNAGINAAVKKAVNDTQARVKAVTGK